MQTDPRLTPPNLTASQTAALDRLLDRIYNYHGEPKPPKAAKGETWAASSFPAGVTAGDHFLHYFQSQGLGPTTNECVTTSTVMAMNLMEDRLRAGRGGALRYEADLRIEDFIRDLESQGLAGWRYRFSTRSPLPGMMPVSGARRTLRLHAGRLRQSTGRSYRVETRWRQGVDDLIAALEQGQIILLHGAWQKRLSDPTDRHLALMGGMPHTMLLVGYASSDDTWSLLNPAEPWLTSRDTPYHPHLFRMTTPHLMDFWGRQFLFYPPRFAITTLEEE